jgi:hypothetical protein
MAQGQLSPTSERRNYNLAPPPLGASPLSPTKADGSGDRLEDLIHQLTKPKEPQLQRRLTWRCVCHTDLWSLASADISIGLCANLLRRHR